MMSLAMLPVGEAGMWMGCGHDADRFMIVLSWWAFRLLRIDDEFEELTESEELAPLTYMGDEPVTYLPLLKPHDMSRDSPNTARTLPATASKG